MIERAITIALEAHAGQVDKNGAPYILHPLRVMLALRGESARIAGVLHDVVEDNPAWTLERLREEGFSQEVVDAVDAVTHRDSESYEAFVKRAAQHPIGKQVKIADLHDNMDITRLTQVGEKERERLERYLEAWNSLVPE